MARYERFFDPRVLARIGRLELRAKMVVEGVISGLHESPYHGQSVEFADHRPYVPGDDPRHIDWKVYGRQGRIVIKKFEEETNLRAHILLDCSESMRFGYGDSLTKYEYAATLAASLAYLLHRQLDAVGVTLFDDEVRERVPVSTNANVLRWMGDAMDSVKPHRKTRFGATLGGIAESIPRRGLVVLISDFFVPREDLRAALQSFTLRKHDIIVFHVLDQTEMSFPFEGNTLFRGLEEYPSVIADPRALQEAYRAVFAQFLDDVRKICSTLTVDYYLSHTLEPLDAAIVAVLAARAQAQKIRR